jgi:tetratricopeptide (TPR) repeat protein
MFKWLKPARPGRAHGPDSVRMLAERAEQCAAQDRLDEAIEAYGEALSLRPDYAELHANLGALHRRKGNSGPAEACYREAIRLRPDFHVPHFNLGNLLREQRRLAEAEAGYRAALACKPDVAAIHHNLGEVLRDQGRFGEAMACYKRALLVAPEYQPSRWHRTLLALLTGDFRQGLAEYGYRWKLAGAEQPRDFVQPLWLGDGDPSGRTILLHAEKGFGDTIQFVRYVDRVAALGARVVLEVPAPLMPLMASYPAAAQW